jgi:signal transduction histidine kinase
MQVSESSTSEPNTTTPPPEQHEHVGSALEATLLTIGVVLSGAGIAAAHLAETTESATFFDNMHWTLSSGMATLVIAVRWLGFSRNHNTFLAWCFAGFAALFLGQCLYDVQTFLSLIAIPDDSSLLFLLRAPLIAIGFLTLINDRNQLLTALLDAAAFGLLLVSLVLIVYLPMIAQVSLPTFITLVAYPVEFFMLAVLSFVIALERKEAFSVPLLMLGISPFAIGTLWTLWNTSVLQGSVPVASLQGDLFSIFNLVWAAGVVYWHPGKAVSESTGSAYEQMMSLLPIGLVIACAISLAFAVPASNSVNDSVFICIVGAMAISILRQSMLLRKRERLLQIEAASHQFREQLLQRQRLEMLGTIASGVAHDVNNVLGAVSTIADLIPLSQSPAETEQFAIDLRTASTHGQEIMQRILRFARPGQKHSQHVAIQALLLEVQRLLETALPKIHSILIQSEPNLTLVGNPSQLYQVFMNLVINASHAIGKVPGEIRITAKLAQAETADADKATWVELSVTDTGCGMSEATLQRVFEPFFTTKPTDVGTGLGLSVVRDIVTEHQGTISLSSTLGAGTVVTIRLPIA